MEYKVIKEEIEPEVGMFVIQGIKDEEVEMKSEKLFLEKEIDFAEDYFWQRKKVDGDGKDLHSEEFQIGIGCENSVYDKNAIKEDENFRGSCSEKSDMSNIRRPIQGILKRFCHPCACFFDTKVQWDNHVSSIHGKKKLLLFKCVECEFSSNVKENVILHISSVHRKEKSFYFDTNDPLENIESPVRGKEIQLKGAESDTSCFADIYARQCNKDEMTLVKLVVELKSKTRKEILQYCMEFGLISKSYKCFKCGGEMGLSKKSVADNYIWRCKVTGGDSAHDITRSVRRGTWFAFSKLSISDILILTYMWVYKYPYKLIVREIDITPHTVTDWLNFAREVCQQIIFSMNTKIGGEGRTVELEESKFVKRKHNRGKGVEGQWVFGGVCRETKDCFLTLVEDRNVATLAEVIKNKILPHTTIYSDCLNVFSALENESFRNLMVNNSIEFKSKEAGCHSDIIECLWKLAKEQLPSRNRSKSLLNSYLAEFIYRKMVLNKETDKFNAFLRDVATVYSPICNDEYKI